MKIIEIETLENGSHRNQIGDFISIPDGWALIPADMKLDNFPFGDIVTEEIEGVLTVTRWTPKPIPTVQDFDYLKKEKIAESKKRLAEWLEAHPMLWTDDKLYSVTSEKQALLTNTILIYQLDSKNNPNATVMWNSTGEVSEEWDINELCDLDIAIKNYVKPYILYQQNKEVEIDECRSIKAVEAVVINYDTLD